MPAWQPAEIGPFYDFGIATRDGSKLDCKNKDGKIVSVSSIAFMASADKSNPQRESTELQEKARLTQLSSSNLIDREFDQWPQVTQGDWSGGAGQRIFGNGGVTDQYWDGEGLLWPLNDYVPQKAFAGPTLPLPANFLNAPVVANSVTTTMVTAATGFTHTQAIASFKAAAGQKITRVGAIGPLTTGTASLVTPAYAQPTTPGSFLVACVGNDSTPPTCTSPGWASVVIGGPNQGASIWIKPVSGLAEAPPTFRSGGGGAPMKALLMEFTGVAAVPTDQFGSLQNISNVNTVTSAAPDAAFGDLVVLMNRSNSQVPVSACTWNDVYNNNITPVRAADDGAIVTAEHFMASYGFVPGNSFPFNDVAGGFVNNGGQGYAYIATTTGPSQWTLFFQAGDLSFSTQIVPVAANSFTPIHLTIGGGFIWVLWSSYPTAAFFVIDQYGIVNGALARIRRDNLGDTRDGPYVGIISSAYVAGKLYTAVATSGRDSATGLTWKNLLYVLDYTAPGAPLGIGAPLSLPSATVANLTNVGTSPFKFTDLVWSGTSLFVAVSDGFNASILSLVSPFTAITETAVLPGLANAFSCAVGSILFIVGVSYSSDTKVNRMDLFSLNGGTLTEFGPVSTPVALVDSITSPVTFGGYAIWTVSYVVPGETTKTITVYAFDVVRGRLFRALTLTDLGWTGLDAFGHNEVAVYGTTTRSLIGFPGVTFQAQFGIALFTGLISNDGETAREFYWGVQPLTPAPPFQGLLQTGVDITSGLVDFTASTNKLFRQLVTDFVDGQILNQITPGVLLSAWFDQDPARLSITPDFTITTTIPTAPPLAKYLKLPTNQIARKLVYRVVTSGGFYNFILGVWQNAGKLVDVVVQASTGWVVDAVLDLSPNAKPNASNVQDYAYQHQSVTGGPSIDHVVAYNFLRQLWRLKGGEIILTLPNQDSYNALIQQMEFASPKPFAASFRSDIQGTYQALCTLKIREDI